jgi:solute carrier family 25 S-adenosylmethionine transporter 26
MTSESFCAGACAGALCDVALHPIDTLKTRLQTKQRPGSPLALSNIRSLYNGIGAVLVSSAPASAIFFATYDNIKASEKFKRFSTNYPQYTPLGYALAAGLADVPAALLRVPCEVVKQRSQASVCTSVSSLTMGRSVVFQEGWQALFSGLGATLARDIPFSFVQFPIYEGLKNWYVRRYPNTTESGRCPAGIAAGFGAFSGGIAAALTCPLDVVKTRRMLGDSSATLQFIAETEGIGSLFKGILPRVVWISAGGLVWLGTYEFVKARL